MKEAFSKLIKNAVSSLLAHILSRIDSGQCALRIKEEGTGRIFVRTVYPYTVSLVDGDKDGNFMIKVNKMIGEDHGREN